MDDEKVAYKGYEKFVKAGIKKFGANLVYLVRSKMTSPGTKAKGKPGRKPRNAAASAPEATFRKLAFDLGLGRARQLINELDYKLKELLAGK